MVHHPDSDAPVEGAENESSMASESSPSNAGGSSPIESEELSTITSPKTISGEDSLPDWEELTPEFFEDECVRGDFMLRWAAILLAVLLGSVFVTESRILVQIRTGQLIAEQGYFPPRTDPFAVATEGKPWVNLHWLTDLMIGIAERSGGFAALTILTAVKLGFSFWILSRIRFKSVPTWWGSICAVIALIALFPAIQPGEMSMTILGFSILLALLHTWREKPDSGQLWGFVPLFIVWVNCDARAWAGLLSFAIYLAAELVFRKASRKQIVIGATALVSGFLISPWPVQPVLGFQEMLANAAQSQTEGLSESLFSGYAYGMLTPGFWTNLNSFPLAAAILLGLSFFCLFLNASRLDWSLTMAWIGMNGLSFYFGELVPYVAVMNCVVASLQGQDWYRNQFKQDYSIRSLSVFVARAGRAVTVLSFFLVAYTAINGLLMNPDGRRIGLGLDPRITNRLDSTAADLLPGIYGERVFNVRIDQGDVLIWLGKKPYLDSRNGLFINGSTNFAERHRAVRSDIFSPGPLAADEETNAEKDQAKITWETEFAEHEIQSLILRLWGNRPAYSPFLMLVGTRSWPMTGFGAAGAVFTRADLAENAELKKHIEEHITTNFSEQAYALDGPDRKIPEVTQIWPRTVSNYDKWLIQKLPVTDNHVQLAKHYNVIAIRLQQALTLEQGLGLATLSLRSAATGLIQTPDDPDAYRILTDALSLLEQAEQRFLAVNGQGYGIQIRSQQTLCQAFHAVKASGHAPADMKRLFVMLLGQQSFDTAAEIADQYFATTGEMITATDEDGAEARKQAEDVLTQLTTHITEVTKQLAEERAKNIPLSQLAAFALSGRCPNLAIDLLEEDRTQMATDPRLQLMYSTLLLAVGRTEEAWEQIEGMQPMIDQIGNQAPTIVSQFRDASVVANLVANMRDRPAKTLAEEAKTQNQQNIQALLVEPPGVATTAPTLDLRAAIVVRTHFSALAEFPERWSTAKLTEALIRIDQGELEQARNALQAIYDGHPEFSMRALVVLYLTLITDQQFEMEPPSQWIPIWEEMFAPDEPEPADAPAKAMPAEPPIPSTTAATPGNPPVGTSKPPTPSLPQKVQE